MRPYFVLCAALVMAVAAFGQQPVPRSYGPAYWGFGPTIPYLTTPMVSFQTVSPNPVGASNATTGLIAGATNSTLSQIEGSTSSEYTVGVWYQGGAPLMTPNVNLFPEPAEREMRAMHRPLAEPGRPGAAPRKEAQHEWMYFTGKEHTASVAAAAASAGKESHVAGHHYSNDDVTRQNDNNGAVKYDGKTEKM